MNLFFWPDHLLGKFRKYRAWRGGQWRFTHVDHPVCSSMWLKVPDNAKSTYSEPLWRGKPIIEDYIEIGLVEFGKLSVEDRVDYFIRKTGVDEGYRGKLTRVLSKKW